MTIDALGALQKCVMETIWELGEATVGQVRDRLQREPQPAYTTILSVVQKLDKAGWLTHRALGRSYVYLPTRSRDQAGTTTLRAFIDRVFRGDALLLFQHLQVLQRQIDRRRECKRCRGSRLQQA